MERRYFVGVDLVMEVKSEVDLGVCIDGELTFDENRQLRIGKANRVVGAIRRAFKFLDQFTFVKIYKAMVRCHLEFAINVWAPYLTQDIEEVECVQKRATKMNPEAKNLNYEERLRHVKTTDTGI